MTREDLPVTAVPDELDVTSARRQAAELGRAGRRRLLGITGPPGAGKSTYAASLVRDLCADGHKVVLVPMDGFHLAQSVLERLGLVAVKGAPRTFDAAGYVDLLRRLATPGRDIVWAPRFDRVLEDSIAGSIRVDPEATLVVTEGNYLLLEEEPWSGIRALLDQCWYLDLPDPLRRSRLVTRHEQHGRSPAEAKQRAHGNDEVNGLLIASTRHRADAVLRPGQA